MERFIGLLAFTWMVVEGAGSIQFIKKTLKVHPDNRSKYLVLQIITELLDCCLCFGFWVGLVYYWFTGHHSPILMACLVSVCSEIFGRMINLLFSRYLNQL
jgi:hypothetical protein